MIGTDWTGLVVDIEAGILAALAIFWTVVRLFGRRPDTHSPLTAAPPDDHVNVDPH